MSRRVLITGVSSGMGRLVARRLLGAWDIVGIDGDPLDDVLSADIEFHQARVGKRKSEDLIRTGGFEALVHLAFRDDPRERMSLRYRTNVVATQKLLETCARHDVRRIVVLSSAAVYGALPDNPIFLDEDAPLRASLFYSGMRDRVEGDANSQAWMYRNPDVAMTILRPCNIIGPTIWNSFKQYITLRVVPTLLGFNPMMQIIHEDDVAGAIASLLALEPERAQGVFNLAGPGELPLHTILDALDAEILPVPHLFALPIMRMMWRSKVLPFPPAQANYLRYPCIVSDARLREVLPELRRIPLTDTLASIRRLRRELIQR